MGGVNEHETLASSYLLRRTKSHSWQKKWFVLRRNQLSYYKDSKEYKAVKVIAMSDVLSFSEIPDHSRWHFIVVTGSRVYHLRALDAKDYELWIRSLKQLLKEEEKPEEETREIVETRASKEEQKPVPTMIRTGEPESQQQELQTFNLSGTDDNFTSGLSDTGYGSQGQGQGQGHWGHSTTSLAAHELPPPIPELSEDDQQQQLSPIVSPAATEYYNSFAYDAEEHVIGNGYLLRLKKRYNQWKRYYIQLSNRHMSFYRSARDAAARRLYKQIDLKELLDVVELDPLSKSKVYCMLLVTPSKRIRFCAESEEELTRWLVLLKTVIRARNVD